MTAEPFCWNKALSFTLFTDYNVDNEVHTQLFLMQKNDILTEYLIKLVKKDLKDQKSPVLDERFRERIALKEMGYKISLEEEELSKALAYKDELLELRQAREGKLMEEANNEIANQYSHEKPATEEIEEVAETKTVDYSESIQRINDNPEEAKAIDNLLGL